MLTKDRPEMAARAVASFLAQTYGDKKLFVIDTGEQKFALKQGARVYGEYLPELLVHRIGRLRNLANAYSDERCLNSEIIIHWDDDDVSHPMRIEEQVALLQSSGADVVGYSDMLFWKSTPSNVVHGAIARASELLGDEDMEAFEKFARSSGEAWLYRNNDRRYCLGTSLCYWRKTWEAKPFNPNLPKNSQATGEDWEWMQGLNRISTNSMWRFPPDRLLERLNAEENFEPRMVASIHGSNTQDYRGIEKSTNSWTRVPQWDDYCRKVMTL